MGKILNDIIDFMNNESEDICVICGKKGAGIGILVKVNNKFRVYAVDNDKCGDKVYKADRETLDRMKYGYDPFEFEEEYGKNTDNQASN